MGRTSSWFGQYQRGIAQGLPQQAQLEVERPSPVGSDRTFIVHTARHRLGPLGPSSVNPSWPLPAARQPIVLLRSLSLRRLSVGGSVLREIPEETAVEETKTRLPTFFSPTDRSCQRLALPTVFIRNVSG